MPVKGTIRTGIKTKELARRLCKEDIAVINHNDIDVISAIALINAGVCTVVNAGCSMTGRTDAKGAKLLLHNNIALYDVSLPFEMFRDSDYVAIYGCNFSLNGVLYRNCCKKVNHEYIRINNRLSRLNRDEELQRFLENSIEHAGMDMEALINFGGYPDMDIEFKRRPVLITVRNTQSMDELALMEEYIRKRKPILIGVDGGADLLLNAGFVPDILLGDMDSVSDIGIQKSREIILHTYPDGYSPHASRLTRLAKAYKTIPIPGTSEDAALLLAYNNGAEPIILIGGHSSMEDFLSKGRNGMGSTIVTRIIVNNKLIDMKNITGLGIKEPPFLRLVK